MREIYRRNSSNFKMKFVHCHPLFCTASVSLLFLGHASSFHSNISTSSIALHRSHAYRLRSQWRWKSSLLSHSFRHPSSQLVHGHLSHVQSAKNSSATAPINALSLPGLLRPPVNRLERFPLLLVLFSVHKRNLLCFAISTFHFFFFFLPGEKQKNSMPVFTRINTFVYEASSFLFEHFKQKASFS